MKDKALKESIIAEYLTAGLSYRQIADKRGVNYRSLYEKDDTPRSELTDPVGFNSHSIDST